MIFFKKKHEINHPIFGKLVFGNSEYVGEVPFGPSGNSIDVYFFSEKKQFDSQYEVIWKTINEDFSVIRFKSVKAVNDSEFDLFRAEISQEHLDVENLVLEAISFESGLSAKLFWGIVDHEQCQTSIQVVTSYEFEGACVALLGGGD